MACGAEYWSKKTIRDVILDDSYKPHTAKEIASLVSEGLISEKVAAKFTPEQRYGIRWYNRLRVRRKQVSEVGPDGPVYRNRVASEEQPRKEWITVPIPNAGVPRGWVDAAREAIKDNRPISSAGRRLWPLSGGMFLCGGCGRRMFPNGSAGYNKPSYVYYRRPKRIGYHPDKYSKLYRAWSTHTLDHLERTQQPYFITV